ncbi:MAG: ParA family protein [Myxococcota bacterium]
MKTVAFFDNKGGGGRSTLVYHLAHMFAEQGEQTLAVDLDPQSNLTAMCLSEEALERLWPDTPAHPQTVLGCVQPLLCGIGDVATAHVEELADGIGLVAGDQGLSAFEDRLSDAWPRALNRDASAFRTLSAFYRLIVAAARDRGASMVLIDVGPNLGAINRAALLAADAIVTPLAPDMFSMQGLRNLGPTLIRWRDMWRDRLDRRPDLALELPLGAMQPLGYVVMQVGMRLNRPVKTYQRWIGRMPAEFHQAVLRDDERPASTGDDPWCLGIMRHNQSLMPLAQDAQKPMFQLKPADGAIGCHMDVVRRCREDFKGLASQVMMRATRSS